MSIHKENPVWFLLLGICSLGGMLLIAAVMKPYGIGMAWDGARYFGLARNVLMGEGLRYAFESQSVLFRWPPLYPLGLASDGMFIPNLFDAARWFQSLLFGLNLFLVGFA